MQCPDQRQRKQDGKDIRGNIDGAGYGGRQKDVDARAWNLRIPSFTHGVTLKNGEKDFGKVVGEDDKGKAPEDDGEAGNETEDAVEEEKGRVFNCGRADAVKHFHRYDSLSGVRVVHCAGNNAKLEAEISKVKHIHTLAYAVGSLRRMTCLPAPRYTAGERDES